MTRKKTRRKLCRAWISAAVFALLLTTFGRTQDKPVDVEVPDSPEGMQRASVLGHTLKLAEEPFRREHLQKIQLPAGFSIRLFAEDLQRPRMMAVADDLVYVVEQQAGEVTVFDVSGSSEPRHGKTAARGLDSPHGLAIHDGYLYVATVKEVLRGKVQDDGSVGDMTAVVKDLPDGGQHPNRTIAFGPDGALFISVGSTCNNCEETNKESATLLRVEPGNWEQREIYASGLRNTIGFAWRPQTGTLWGMDHGSDWRGDNVPPEELNRIEQGQNYGWPYCYGDREPDVLNPGNPQGESKASHCRETAAPVLTYQAHTAPIAMVFHDGNSFPDEYRGDAFVALRGSWNREPAVGYKVVRIRFDEGGEPIEFVDFATGWLMQEEEAEIGRLAGLAVSPTGSLLLGDDRNGIIYEIYQEQR